jgi:GxxExxY protein
MHEKDQLSHAVIGAAIEVHRHPGPGLLESVYDRCLRRELELRDIPFRKQVELPVVYKDIELDKSLVIDILVAEQLVLELKAVERIEPVHEAQLLTYLRLSNLHVGLLMNFNVPVLRDGIKRMVL